jgi:hypothetical protein
MAFKREMDFNQLYALEYIFLSALEQEKTNKPLAQYYLRFDRRKQGRLSKTSDAFLMHSRGYCTT